MNGIISQLEDKLTIVALIFYSRVLDFESLYRASEGTPESLLLAGDNPFGKILSLFQHGIFLCVLFLLIHRYQATFKTLFRGKVIWLLILMVPLSSLWSNVPEVTQPRSLAFIETCTFGLYFASRYNVREQLRIIAWALGIASIISLLYTLALPGHAIENGIHAGAWRGPFIQKNIFSRLLTLSCLVYVCVKPETSLQKVLVKAGLFLSFGLIILTNSKTALMVLILLLVVWLGLKSLRFNDLLAVPLVLSLFLLVSTAGMAIWVNAESILGSIGKDLTLSGRTTIWAGLIEQIKLRPWHGYGYLGFWSNTESRSLISKIYGTTYNPPHSHNGYIELAIAFGIIGTILFTLTFLAITRRAAILTSLNHSNEGLWPLLFLAYLLFYNFSEPTLIEHNSIFWIIYLSLALSKFLDIPQESSFLNSEPISITS